MDKTELINDITVVREMLERQMKLIEQLQEETRKGQLVLDELMKLYEQEQQEEIQQEEEIIEIEEFGGGLFG